MKKTLIALAAIAATSAALAQSTVTIGGKANFGLQQSSYNNAASAFGKNTKLLAADAPDGSSSRIYFKGAEDLGGGLKANFHMEQQVDLTNGATQASAFARQAWMGLSGGFGEIRAGRQYTLGFMSSIGYMPSTSTTAQVVFASNGTNGTATTGASNGTNFFNTVASRDDAQLRYSSPSFGGLKVEVATQLSGNTASALTELHVGYAAGPLAASFYTSKTKNVSGSNMAFNGSYDLGVAKVLGGYVDRAGSNTGKGYFLGASAPVGAMTVGAVYARNSDSSIGATEVYGRYPLSKRTTAYAHYRTGSKLPVKSLLALGLDHNF